MKIENEVILVTGANRGLGRELVLASLKAGARRVYANARNPEQLAPLVDAGEERVVPVVVDVTRQETLDRAAETAPDVSLLFNNADVVASHHVLDSSTQAIEQDFATNFFGVVAATKTFLPALERAAAQRRAAIVNILSVVSLVSAPVLGGYSASKAAASSLTQALRSDLAPRRIQVHGVFAGAIDTDMTKGMNIPKASPVDVARAIIKAVEADVEDIYPDAMSEGAFATWRRDPKELERQLAGLSG